MLSGFGAVWLPLLLISGHRASLPWLIAEVLVAAGTGAVTVNAAAVWALVRTRPYALDPPARRSTARAVSLTHLILLPGSALIATLSRSVRRSTGSSSEQPGGEHRC
jgi:hypothetical protein